MATSDDLELVQKLARGMFDRRCDLDGSEPALVELAWLDENIRLFWEGEARHAIVSLQEPCAWPTLYRATPDGD